MFSAELEVCVDCGTLHMEGGAGPDDVDECAVCGGRVTDVELEDLVGL
jgi:rRNA maturation endonuclease Nob1